MRFATTTPFAARAVIHTALGISNGVLVAAVCGVEGMATWTVAASWRAILLAITESVLDAGSSPIAAARGRGDTEGEARATSQAVVVGVFVSAIMALMGLFAAQAGGGLVEVVAGAAAGEVGAAGFCALMLLADAAGTAADGVRAVLLGRGRGGASAAAGAACKATQLLLGWILIPRWGLLGMLVAHTASQMAETLLQLAQGWHHLSGVRLGEVRASEVLAQLRFGAASAASDALRNTLYAGVVGGIEATTGPVGVALHAACVKVFNLHFKVFCGVSGGASPEVAAAVASGQRPEPLLYQTAKALAIWGAILGCAYAALPTYAWEALAPGATGYRGAVLAVLAGMPLEVLAFTGGAYLRATQHAKALLLTETVGASVMAAGAWLALRAGFGVPGVWASFALDAGASAAIAWWVIHSTRRG